MNRKCTYNYTCDVCRLHHIDKSVNKHYCMKTGKEIKQLSKNTAMKEEIKEILDTLVSDIQGMEYDCFHQMSYMDEHKFNMEREAIRYAQGAYNRSCRKVSVARRKIFELMDEQKTNK